jgi:hypothetical protein
VVFVHLKFIFGSKVKLGHIYGIGKTMVNHLTKYGIRTTHHGGKMKEILREQEPFGYLIEYSISVRIDR